MGKIPKKKHRGVKDPYKQQAVRLNSLKMVNQKPASIEVQELPRKLQVIASFNNQKNENFISGSMKNKKRKRNECLIDGTKFIEREREQHGMSRPTKMIPVMKQHLHEDNETFLKRVDHMTKAVVKESKFEEMYNVEVGRGFQGQVTAVTPREKLQLDIMQQQNKPQDTSRSQKKRLIKKDREEQRKLKRKRKAEDEADDFSYLQDKVEFGEVVTEPPTLDTKKLASKVKGSVPKAKTFLFMDKMKPETSQPEKKKGNKKFDNESLGHKRMLEEERLRVMEAYRKVKATRTHAVPPSAIT